MKSNFKHLSMLAIMMLVAFVFCAITFLPGGMYASQSQSSAVEAVESSSKINYSGIYETPDNKDYKPSQSNMSGGRMSFGATTMGQMKIFNATQKSSKAGVPGYAMNLDGQVRVEYAYSRSNGNLNNQSGDNKWMLSSDSASVVNGRKLEANIKAGAFIIEKRYSTTENFSLVKAYTNVFNSPSYLNYGLDGSDVSRGTYYRITLAYEIYREITEYHSFWFVHWTTTSKEYRNCMEIYDFYVAVDSTKVQFKELKEKDYTQYVDPEDAGVAQVLANGDTLQNGSITTAGFTIVKTGNEAATVSVSKNDRKLYGLDFQVLFNSYNLSGKYDITVTSAFGQVETTTIYVANGGTDKGYAMYFGESFFRGKRIANTDVMLPTYNAGVVLHLNGVGNFIPQLYGTVVNHITGYTFPINKSSAEQNIELSTEGLYSVRLTNSLNPELAGSFYEYSFDFLVAKGSSYPSINYANVVAGQNFCDFETKMIEVLYTMPTGKIAHICFDKEAYVQAYQFAYSIEKKYVAESGTGYTYLGNYYDDELALVEAMNTQAESKIKTLYINPLNTSFYMDETSLSISMNIDNLNYTRDVYLSTAAGQGQIFQRENIVGSDFRFLKLGDYESQTIVAKNMKNGKEISIKYNIDLGKQLKESGKYHITETNCYNEKTEYDIVYSKQNMSKVSFDVNGAKVEVEKSGYKVINGKNIILENIVNEFDSDGYVFIIDLANGTKQEYSLSEAKNISFGTGTYVVMILDRCGNDLEIVINNNLTVNKSFKDAFNEARLIDNTISQLYYKYYFIFPVTYVGN